MKNKMEKPKISVLIPVRNSEKTLRECLNSVLYQDYKDYEVVVVDNNSTDRTKEIIKEFQKKNKRIKYVFEPKIGRGPARSAGGRKARGEIILMTDSDCVVPTNWIREMIEPIIKDKQTAVQGIKKAKRANYWTRYIEQEGEKLVMEHTKGEKTTFLDTANFAIKKSALKEVGYTHTNLVYGEDTELMIRLKTKGYSLYLKKFAVLHYHPDTFSKVFKKYFKRAEWDYKIRKSNSTDENLFTSFGFIYHLEYLLGLISELVKFKKRFLYDLTTGVAWRLGTLYGWMKK